MLTPATRPSFGPAAMTFAINFLCVQSSKPDDMVAFGPDPKDRERIMCWAARRWLGLDWRVSRRRCVLVRLKQLKFG